MIKFFSPRNNRTRQFYILLIAVLSLIAAFIVASPWVLAATDDFDFTPTTSSRIVAESNTATHTFVLTNRTTTDITVNLTKDDSNNAFVSSFQNSSVVIPASGTVNAILHVFAPDTLAHNIANTTIVTATHFTDTAKFETVQAETISIEPSSLGVNISTVPPDTSAAPGSQVTLNYTIQNTGSTSETFVLSAASSESWSYIINNGTTDAAAGAAHTISLNSGETKNVSVRLSINANAINGESDRFTFSAASQLLPSVFASDEVIVTVEVAATSSVFIYADALEPNNALTNATVLTVNGTETCMITLWPSGDEDFFRFDARAGRQYTLKTTNLSTGLDTYLTAFGGDGLVLGQNDNVSATDFSSTYTYVSSDTTPHYFKITNLGTVDPANLTYCVQVTDADAPTPTPSSTPTATQTPTQTPTGTQTPTITPSPTTGGDTCEPNQNRPNACVIAPGQTVSGNFEHPFGGLVDEDYYQMWTKQNVSYTCATSNLSALADTRMEIRDDQWVWLGDNDDTISGDPTSGSEVTFVSRRSGYVWIIIRPFTAPLIDRAADYTYDLVCTAMAPTPTPVPTETPVPTNTPVPNTSSGGGAGTVVIIPPTAVPTQTPQPAVTIIIPDTPTPFPTQTALPNPVIEPLATPTIVATTPSEVQLDVLLYYDQNNNFLPELNEGIMDVAVSLYDNTTGQLLAFGYTNEGGLVSFGPFEVSGAVRVTVSYFNFSQIVPATSQNVQMRIAPLQLPNSIP